MRTRHHDLVVIGTGSGNSLLGPELDDLDIGLVEGGTFGGTCLNVGCIPTKMFVVPADRVVDAMESARLGVHVTHATADWSAIRDRVFGRIDPISASGEAYRQKAANITLYQRMARFVGPMTLDTGTGVTVTADRWVIAAGSRPRTLDVRGLEVDPERGVHTSDSIMRLETLPRRIAIIGGGFVAAELAHVLDAMGTEVTWVHRGAALLTAEDGAVSSAFTALAAQRFDLRLRTTVGAARRAGDGTWTLRLDGPLGSTGVGSTGVGSTAVGSTEVEVGAVLLAVGRRPNTDLLDAAAAGLPTHPDGRLVVDPQQRTPVEGVFALGDISSPFELKHAANHEMRVVRHNLSHPDSLVASDHRFVPHAVFTHPQIASFGPREEDLRAAGVACHSHTQQFGDVAYGWALEDTTGFVKVVIDPQSRLLLAAHILGPEASTLIQPLIQAAHFGQRADDVAKNQYWIHPALSEVVENALLGLG